MSTLPEQISAASKSQVETQMHFFQNVAAKALESTQKILAFNLAVSRASIEKSSAAMADLFGAKDPRDLFALTKRAQESIDGLMAYNRELVAIATGASTALVQEAVEVVADAKAPARALAKPAPVPEAAAPEAATPELVAPAFVAPVAEPEVAALAAVTATPAAPPEAKAKPIAKAVSKVATKAVAAKPAAAPVPAPAPADKPVLVTGIKPVEATRPPAPVSGKPVVAQQQQQLDLPAAKTKKKK
ncbi:MAG: phasin family protein [Telluria sp.]